MEAPTDAMNETPETTTEAPETEAPADIITEAEAEAIEEAAEDAGGFEIDEALLLEKAETLDKIAALAREVETLEQDTDRAHKAYKSVKADWEGKAKDLTRLIKKSTEALPLFDRKAEPAPAVATDPDDDAWRDEPAAQLVSFGLSDSIMQALEAADLLTMGDLADWTKDGRRRVEDIPGIGPAKAEALSDALGKFWSDYFAKQRRAMQSEVDAFAASLPDDAPSEAPDSAQDAATGADTSNPSAEAGEPASRAAKAIPDEAAKQVHEPNPGPMKIEPKKSRNRKAG